MNSAQAAPRSLGRTRQDFTDEARNSVRTTRVTYLPQLESATSYAASSGVAVLDILSLGEKTGNDLVS
jgi:hypothetical protein